MLSIGIMGLARRRSNRSRVTGAYGCGYVKSKDYWRLGAIFGVIYISMLLLVVLADSRGTNTSPNAE
ncbi:anion permease [Escherichia coli]|nr:anion permease [Escherichia coli]